MLGLMQRYFNKISSIYIDGSIYVCLALLTGMNLTFGSDDAEKYMTGIVLFWIKAIVSWVSAGLLALKMYRSTAFAEHQDAKQATANNVTASIKSTTTIETNEKNP